ncbi:hypothetical protein CASFOL_001196 [Castilleja foliolosa]|uniref:Pectinesterase inhibitor domain-containing protein n=1 Tax=Castilleja foliolosa TaxID=1961234 RepID=A0ABD3ELW7_9LAMI
MAILISPYACFSFVILICLQISQAAPVDEICIRTSEPYLCLQALGGPATRKDTLAGAAEIGLQTAGMGAIRFQNIFKELSSSPGSSPDVKVDANKCANIYDNIFKGLIASAHESARVGRWPDVITPVKQIDVDIDTCEGLFNGNSPVHGESRKVRVAAEAIALIAAKLS